MALLCFVFARLYWGGQRLFGRPTAVQAIPQRVCRDANMLRPVDHAHCRTVVSQHPVCTSVASLLLARSPSCIPWFVVAIVIWEAVECVLVARTRPHVHKKVFKREPPVTHIDAASAVPMVVAILCVTASFEHVLPRQIFRCANTSLAVSRAGTSCALSALSATQDSTSYRLLKAALTAAKPEGCTTLAGRMVPKYGPFAECLTGKVYEGGAALSRLLSSHSSLLVRFGWIGPARSYNLLAGPCHFTVNGDGRQAHA